MNASPLFLAGLLVLGAGAAGDLTYHALDQGTPMFRSRQQATMHQQLQSIFGRDGQRAHLVTLAGMVLTVGGVATRGMSRRSL